MSSRRSSCRKLQPAYRTFCSGKYTSDVVRWLGWLSVRAYSRPDKSYKLNRIPYSHRYELVTVILVCWKSCCIASILNSPQKLPKVTDFLRFRWLKWPFIKHILQRSREDSRTPLQFAIFSERELTFTFSNCCRPSVVCRLSVCNARALYSGG